MQCSTPDLSTKCEPCTRAATFTPDLPAMRSVGYRQAWRFVEGRCSLDEFRLAGYRRIPAIGEAADDLVALDAGCDGYRANIVGHPIHIELL